MPASERPWQDLSGKPNREFLDSPSPKLCQFTVYTYYPVYLPYLDCQIAVIVQPGTLENFRSSVNFDLTSDLYQIFQVYSPSRPLLRNLCRPAGAEPFFSYELASSHL